MKKKKIIAIGLVLALTLSLFLPILPGYHSKFVNAAATGLKSPTATGDDYNDWIDPTFAYNSDNDEAEAEADGDTQDYYDFSFSGISGEIDGIEIKLESQGSDGVEQTLVELSWDGGASYTTSGKSIISAEEFSIQTLGGSTDTWGRTWSDTEFSNTNFRVRVEHEPNDGDWVLLDHIQAKVYYTPNQAPNTPSLDSPDNNANGIGLTPDLKTTATDDDTDDLQYKIELCTNEAMTENCQTFDQTSSQTGWSGQNAQGGTAYASNTQATYTIQTPLTNDQTYYWRSYAIDPWGSNTWSSTQSPVFSFTTNDAPTAPTSLETEGATNPTKVTDTTPEFTAIYNDPDTGDTANKYRIQVDDDSDFLSTIWDSGAAGTSMTNCTQGNRCDDISYNDGSLSWGTKYYWRIKYWDDGGLEGVFSTEEAHFTMNKVPNTPTLVSPTDTATNQSLTPDLETYATDPDSPADDLQYKIELCTNEAMTENCQTFDQSSSQTGWSGQDAQGGTAYASGTHATYTLQSALDANTTYYWRSYAIDPWGTNTWSSASAIWDFTTSQAPTAPTSLETEGSTNPTGVTDTTPEFSAVYNDPDTGDVGKKYRIQVDDDPGFGSTIWDSGASGSSMSDCTQGTRCQEISYAGGSLSWGTKYYWQIKYWDDKGAEGAWSIESAHFTMNYVPNAPNLNSPSNGASNQSVTPDLKATAIDPDSPADYLRYKIQLDKVDTFDSGDLQTFDQTSSQTGWSGQDAESGTAYASGTQATYTIQSALDAGTTYYWRSYAIDPGGTNTWSSASNTFSFTTTQNPSAPSDLEAEEDTNPTNVTDTTPEFTAIYNDPDTGDTAVYYQIQVNTQSDFGGSEMWDSTKTSMSPLTEGQRSSAVSYDGSALQWGETYYWRIKFWDNGGTASPWNTETAYFTMGSIAAPSNCLIDDGGQPNQLIVKWQDNTGLETGYRIERNTDSGGFAYLADEAADSTSHTDSTTSADHTYQYRVRAESASGNSGWCTTMTVNLAEGNFKFSGVRLEGLMIE